jgi:hypothetical protein
MRFKLIWILAAWLVVVAPRYTEAQVNATRVKTGWTFGVVPVLGYNTDIGFKYGIMGSVYDYGKESTYPKYKKMLRFEVSRSTKGSGINQLFFDSDRLFGSSRIRLSIDLSYLTDKASDFYGFNGKEANYNHNFNDDESPNYISRVYYGMDRQLLRIMCDFKGPIIKDRFYWLAGVGIYNYETGSVDIDRLNKGKSEDKQLPDTSLLYDKYVSWGLIPAKDADGGHHQVIKAGIIYDSRDTEANPSHGIWSEVLFIMAPSFLWNDENAFTRIALTHRQYFTIVHDQLTFVYRLSYQGTINGTIPFYSMPYFYSSYLSCVIEEGLGGAKSMRGILRDRLIGDGIAYGNFEFRWKFLKAVIWKQNIYFALNPFLDAGRVVQLAHVDQSKVPPGENLSDYFTGDKETFHYSAGLGLHIALNENFVVAADFGYAFAKQDGALGVYIGVNWLF